MEAIKTHKHTILRLIFFVAIGFSLLLSLTLIWLQNTVYKPDNLSNIARSVLEDESTRNAIGDMVSETVFEDRPVAGSVVGPRLSNVVSGLLNTDLAGNIVESTVEKIRIAVTTDEDLDVSINLALLKSRLVNVQGLIGDGERIDIDKIPDEIVLFEARDYDKYFDAGRKIIWLWPILMLFSIGGLAYWIYRGRKNALSSRIRIGAVVLLVVGVTALLVGPIIEPTFISIARDAQSQTILSNLYKEAMHPYWLQAIWLCVLAVGIFAISYLFPLYAKLVNKK